MSLFLDNLKRKAQTVKAAAIGGKIVTVSKGAKSVVCKNHLSPDKKTTMKIIIPVIPKMKEYICTCQTIYKFV